VTAVEDLKGPLTGRRIVVTRTREQSGTLTEGLRKLGAEVVDLPTIEIVPPDSYQPLDDALHALASYEWLIVTSANTVRAIGERLAALYIDPAILCSVKIAAVGSSTAAALHTLGASAALVPPQYVAESLVDAMRDRVTTGSRILLARANAARDVIPDALETLGATVEVVDAYRTVIPDGAVVAVRDLFASSSDVDDHGAPLRKQAPPDAVTFTSSSTVKHFLALLADAAVTRPPGLRAISIGPITSATLRENGWEPMAEAVNHDVQGLIAATLRALGHAEPRSKLSLRV
jgi:uroporphyrinogen-III synthase